jgi:hypothetical protein
MRKLIPPPSTDPVPFSPYKMGNVILVFTQKKRPIEIKYVEKGIII